MGLAVTALIGCGSNTTPPASTTPLAVDTVQEQLIDIRIPDTYTPNGAYTPYIATAKGFYREFGINPVFTGVIGPGQHVAAVVAGDNDVGTLHVNRTINGIAAGANIKAVVADSETSEEFPHMEFVTLDTGPLKEPIDLAGKKLGINAVGGCNEYTPYGILEKNGFTKPQGQFEIVLVPAGGEETALLNGDIDVVGYHGHPLDVFGHGQVRVLFDDYDVWETVGGATPWYFREDFIANNPDAVRRFVAAHAKTLNWVNEHRQEAKEIIAEWHNIPVESVTIMNYAKDGIIKEDSVQVWIDILTRYGELKADVPAKSVFTNEFNSNSPDYKFKNQ
jgi:ABC-type nitrate/sulfonate/bicarbonate transport system substrate-binding protein